MSHIQQKHRPQLRICGGQWWCGINVKYLCYPHFPVIILDSGIAVTVIGCNAAATSNYTTTLSPSCALPTSYNTFLPSYTVYIVLLLFSFNVPIFIHYYYLTFFFIISYFYFVICLLFIMYHLLLFVRDLLTLEQICEMYDILTHLL